MDLASASVQIERLTTQQTVNRNLHEGVCTAFSLQNTASQQRVTADAKNRGKSLADKADINK